MTQFIKRFTLLMVIAALLSGHSFAQLGIQVGWNTTNYALRVNDVKQDRFMNWGVNAGVLYRIGIVKHLAVQPELLFSRKGATNNNNGTTYVTGVSKWVNKLDYVELAMPILLRMPLMRKVSFDLGAGPYGGSLVKAVSQRHDLSGDKTNIAFKVGNDTTDDFKRMDIGYMLYMGMRIKHVNFSFCYERSMIDVNPANTETTKNGCFSMNFGILF